MKQISSAIANLLKTTHSFVHLVKIGLDTPIYLTDDSYDRTSGGANYIAGILEISESFTQSGEPKTNDAKLKLNDPDRTFASIVLQGGWYNKDVEISRLYLDENGQPIDSVIIWVGYVDSATDENSIVTITAASIWADFEKSSGRRTNNGSQQKFFPNDECFAETGSIVKDLPWGKASPNSGNSGLSDPGKTPPQAEK